MAVLRYQDQLRQRKRRRRFHKLLVGLGVIFLIVGGLVYFLFFAKILDVRSVDLSGYDRLQPDELMVVINNWLDQETLGLKRRDNLWLTDVSDLQALLSSQFIRLESIKAIKKYPHTLMVTVSERQPVGIWCLVRRASCFYFDQAGIAFAETGPSAGFLLTNVNDQRDREISLGSLVISQSWLKSILTAEELLAKINLEAREFSIPEDSFDEFHAATVFGWQVLLSASTDIPKQISTLANFLKQKISSEQLPRLQYIDLRLLDRIYYK